MLVDEIERWTQADADAVVAYLADPAPGSVLALFGDATRLRGLAEACRTAGDVVSLELPRRKQRGREVEDYVAWTRARFEAAGVAVDPDAVERLVELVGHDAFALESEIAKLATWSNGEPIRAADVEALAVPAAEESASALANAWSARNPSETLRVCEQELRGRPEPFWLSGRLAAHVSRTRAVQRLLDDGVPLAEIGKRLGLRFPPRREAAAASAFSAEELESAIVRLSELDLALKGGSRLDPVLELERALIETLEPSPHSR